ncbi:iron-sulfur cluster carrier protein ApbC [Glaciecola sp. 2405UD65-10]|uniref:iron-sulfur cluster carrier protein ApbC n=1 Tax=Glaciecola sp. 2405UD65-10 TaxID=3397244 RepID=UPI003B5B12B1
MSFFSSKNKPLSGETLEQIIALIEDFFELKKENLITAHVDNKHNVWIRFPFLVDSVWPQVQASLSEAGLPVKQIQKQYNIPIFNAKQMPVANVKNIIAVSSGKGGVGKSASALNLALALQLEGARVGILDADIYGPSIPIMLGTQGEHPQSKDEKNMQPVMAHGLASNSIGYLVDNEHASIWRGPMASKALGQLLKETVWPTLDYLIVDMPPGTGDIQLTMCQQLPLTAAVVVTTPQDIALSDAGKGIAMFEKLEIPVLGLIENMSYFECGHCHKRTAIFSEKGAQKLSSKYNLPILAQVPLNPIIREFADEGRSLLHEQQAHPVSIIYREAAINLSRNLCEIAQVLPLAANMASSIEVTRLD